MSKPKTLGGGREGDLEERVSAMISVLAAGGLVGKRTFFDVSQLAFAKLSHTIWLDPQ